jgi:ribosome biogenesis GTPase
MSTGRYDEHDHEHYERPRRRTRPRTKERPRYDDAAEGTVTTVDRGRFTLLVDGVVVWAVKARPLGRKGVVVGDRVRITGDVSGDEGTLARIVEVQERRTVLRRTADDDDPVERVIVANADQLVVVTALADPEPRPRLIDRALVAAYDAKLKPLLCLTKADLADPETLLATYRSLGVPWVVTQRGGDLTDLRARLAGLPGFGDMKVRGMLGVLTKRFGLRLEGLDEIAPKHPTLGDVDSPEARERYQEAKRAYKARMKQQQA